MKKLFPFAAVLLLSACLSQDPGTQCLNSFKATLKDPDSGKVISFEEPTLIYSATNSYGARTQGKALCRQFGEKWARDSSAELVAVLSRSTDKLKKSNDCRAAGGKAEACAGESTALRLSAITLTNDEVALHEESRKELGF